MNQNHINNSAGASPRKIVFMTAGNAAKKLTEKMAKDGEHIEIVAYLDNDPSLMDTFLFDKPILHPSKISSLEYDTIIIASSDKHYLTKQLIGYGVPIERIDTDTFSHCGNSGIRIAALQQVSKLIYDMDIKGSVAELGVYQGEFAKHINAFFPDRLLYLFDTFEGFSNNDIEEEKRQGTEKFINGSRFNDFSETSIEIVLNKMEIKNNCIVKKGYFPESALGIEDDFCFVSLDADLYKPMLAGLNFFYPRLVKGGIIFVHDYFSDDYTGTKKAVMDYKQEHDICYIPIGDSISVAIIKP